MTSARYGGAHYADEVDEADAQARTCTRAISHQEKVNVEGGDEDENDENEKGEGDAKVFLKTVNSEKGTVEQMNKERRRKRSEEIVLVLSGHDLATFISIPPTLS